MSSKVFVNAAGGLIAAVAFAILTWAWHKWPELMENARRYQEVSSGYSHFPTPVIAFWLSILKPIIILLVCALFFILMLASVSGVLDSRKADSSDRDFFTFNVGLFLGVLTPLVGYLVVTRIPGVWDDAVFMWTK
ncbi:hypothetical protein [Mycobacteroides abscessus]|uniref:hypothetical protein n=1 Tax=Mycobacteroides abscessus TaxID=36809 RepID=UPI001054137D|nr:hypothetical protein [Mycobacteroides abscessus]